MVGEDFNRGMGGGMNLEVWFEQQNLVSVFLESSVVDPDEEQFYETCLFSLYAARQIANLRGDGMSLAFALQAVDTSNALEQTKEALGDVRVGAPSYTASGRKGFTCELRPDKRAFFKLNGHGFGMMGRGVGYYAPTSTLALLYWMLDRRKDDPLYQRALAATAENVGILGARGAITVTSQAPMAMQAATAAWEEAREAGEVADLQLSEDVRAACEVHGINFPALVAEAGERIRESLSEMDGAGRIAVPDAVVKRVCQVEVILAADVDDDESVSRAFAAVEAAEATENGPMIEAANSHYDTTLAEIVDANELESVVDALEAALFTRDGDSAAEF